jgi:hypothetical protein
LFLRKNAKGQTAATQDPRTKKRNVGHPATLIGPPEMKIAATSPFVEVVKKRKNPFKPHCGTLLDAKPLRHLQCHPSRAVARRVVLFPGHRKSPTRKRS